MRDEHQGFPRCRSTVTENFMSTEHFIDGRYVMVVKGAVDVLLDRMRSHSGWRYSKKEQKKTASELKCRINIFQKTDCEFLHLHLRRWNRSKGLH
ncbi:MAG: hypothetical protein ACLRWM_07245 [Streptococcus sp.]